MGREDGEWFSGYRLLVLLDKMNSGDWLRNTMKVLALPERCTSVINLAMYFFEKVNLNLYFYLTKLYFYLTELPGDSHAP